MHLQRITLIAICVSFVCIVHSVAAMDNPELQEGLRKRATSQPLIDQFEGPTLTKHSIDTKKIEDNIDEEEKREKREKQTEEKEKEDIKTALNRGVEWTAKNKACLIKTGLAMAGLGLGIWIFSQLIVSADAAAMFNNNREAYKELFEYYKKNLMNTTVDVAGEKLAEAAERAQDNEVVTGIIITQAETD
ncbi:hypothetical protein NECID01_0343 [Nematocida sp. AWRm77]|nr:hypothetical protein NECID01_0343 [Nematocida sp. AWRm77]